MSTHPALTRALASERAADHCREAMSHREDAGHPLRARAVDGLRYGAGWLLIDLGLRLAIPKRGPRRSMARAAR